MSGGGMGGSMGHGAISGGPKKVADLFTDKKKSTPVISSLNKVLKKKK